MVECRDGGPVGNQPSTLVAGAPAFVLALMGLPGAGKSSCLDALGIDRSTADMDEALGGQAPTVDAAVTLVSPRGRFSHARSRSSAMPVTEGSSESPPQ